jgi:polygalacturonase
MKPAFLLLIMSVLANVAVRAADFDVRSFGAAGDGKTLDTAAINKAIEAAAAAGGGTVRFPAGTYLSFSIHLKSNLTLQLDQGATILAATAAAGFGSYDPYEPNEWGDRMQYQDFGHSHWHNSLMWGENLENLTITGQGKIDGSKGLVRNAGPISELAGPNGTTAPGSGPVTAAPVPAVVPGNKAIALKLCRNVEISDITLYMGGHFALLATGVDNLTIDNVKVDTNRDGFDIDACRNVRVSNCSVNSPQDDGIVLKSSYALGFARATENVTITNCQLSGYDPGTFLDGTFKRTLERAPDRDGPTGRIKFGTESNGGFKNISISNCVFDRSRGIAIETVDGGPVEDVVITNITMRDVSNSPLFLRIGNRARGPAGMPVSTMRRITISNVTAYDADPRYASIIAGLPGHPIEDVTLTNIRIVYRGGLTMTDVRTQALANNFFAGGRGTPAPDTTNRDPYDVPDGEKLYPEPSMFGVLPSYGLFVRHATNVLLRDVQVGFMKEDGRPSVLLWDVAGITFDNLTAQKSASAPLFMLRDVTGLVIRNSAGIPDTRRDAGPALTPFPAP